MDEKKKTPIEGEVYRWQYPEYDGTPPGGQNYLLLTVGGTPTIGQWNNSGTFIAWSRLPKRDRSKEPAVYYERYGANR